VWTGYSTKDTADVVGLSQSIVRQCMRCGMLDSPADHLPLRFSFQDLKILKALKALVDDGVSLRRAQRELLLLRQRLADTAGETVNSSGPRTLSGTRIEAQNGHVVVCEEGQVWRADSGQGVFNFQLETLAGEVAELPQTIELPVPEFMENLSADEWFDQALQIEESNPTSAVAAYEQVLRHRPECTESLINIGRLHAESAELELASEFFEKALAIDPREPTALYNLGVIAQDSGNDNDAINYYEAALAVDRELAEAHYNLATIFDRSGDARSAIRHINEFRKLNKRR